MKEPTDIVALRPAQAACLHAIRTGKATRTEIAVGASLTLKAVDAALNVLCALGLIERGQLRRRWVATEHGKSVTSEGAPPLSAKVREGRSSRMRIGPSDQRLLQLLDRPMSGADLAKHLNVSPQRVRQLVTKLRSFEKVRVADEDRPFLLIARREDPSVLLSYRQERALSALSPTEETTPARVAALIRRPTADVLDDLHTLCSKGLVRVAGQSKWGVHYGLTEAGSEHVQYRLGAKKAEPVPLAVKSDRVCQVLSHLANHGPARTRDLREALSIAHPSINALMQYLKRRGLVRKTEDGLTAPFELTGHGLETQQAMIRRCEAFATPAVRHRASS